VKPTLPPGTRPATRTFTVLAGAYRDKSLKSTLTHAAEVDVNGYPVKVLCKRVDVDHLCPDYPSIGGTTDVPTCPVCLKRSR
jgi:hypothetical protein